MAILQTLLIYLPINSKAPPITRAAFCLKGGDVLDLKIEYVPVDSIKPYEGNAKEHPQDQIDQIAKSIEELGFNDPIAVWNDTVCEGHGRLLAARQLGMVSVPVIRLDGLTEEQRRAYALIHNQLTMNSGYDFEKLVAELENISDIDMPAFDLDISDFQEQLDRIQSVEKFSMDEIEEPNSHDKHSENKTGYFSSEFTFPIEHKSKIINFLRKNKKRIIGEIVAEATGE